MSGSDKIQAFWVQSQWQNLGLACCNGFSPKDTGNAVPQIVQSYMTWNQEM